MGYYHIVFAPKYRRMVIYNYGYIIKKWTQKGEWYTIKKGVFTNGKSSTLICKEYVFTLHLKKKKFT